MTVAGDRGGADRRRDRSVVPIDVGRRRGQLGDWEAIDQITDEGALESVQMLDRVTGGGPQRNRDGEGADPPSRARVHKWPHRNPWTSRVARARDRTVAPEVFSVDGARLRASMSPAQQPARRRPIASLTPPRHALELVGSLILIAVGVTLALVLSGGSAAVDRPPSTSVGSSSTTGTFDFADSLAAKRREASLSLAWVAETRQPAAEHAHERARARARRAARARAR